jgi:hypothetical protein
MNVEEEGRMYLRNIGVITFLPYLIIWKTLVFNINSVNT